MSRRTDARRFIFSFVTLKSVEINKKLLGVICQLLNVSISKIKQKAGLHPLGQPLGLRSPTLKGVNIIKTSKIL